MRILIVEDSRSVADWIQAVMQGAGHDTTAVPLVADGIEAGRLNAFDLALVDLDLPDGNGLTVVRALRAAGRTLPIIIMTGRDDDATVVAGLDAGADDYLVKPVASGVLRARVRAALRRATAGRQGVLSIGPLTMNRMQRSVTAGGAPVPLTAKEFALLEHFMLRPDQVVSRADLLEQVWGVRSDTYTNVVDTTVSRLRQKLQARVASPVLRTVRGTGFLLETA